MKPTSKGSAPQIPNNLPPRPTIFVDREEEIHQVINTLLDGKTPIVALVGIAGIGKTTLALEIAHRLLDMGEFTGGIVWFPARSLRPSDSIVASISTTLGSPPAEALTQLNSQRSLVVLDGLDEIDTHRTVEVERFLSSLPPQIKALVTSRKQPALKQATTVHIDTFTEGTAKELLESLNVSQVLYDTYLQRRWGIDELIRILGYHPLALTLAARLLQFNYTEARKNLQQLLAVSESLENEQERFTLLFNFALQLREQGDYTQALQLYERALETARQSSDRVREANALKAIGDLRGYLDERDAALESYAQALALFRAVGDRLGEANTLKAIGDIQQFRKELDAALESYAQALALFRAVGDRLGEANTLKAIGDIQQFRKELEAALESYAQALMLFRAIGAKLGEANVLQAIGDVQQFRGEADAALESYAQALALFRAVGDRLGEANTLKTIGDIRRSRRELDAALEIYKESEEIFHWIGAKLGLANVLQSIGEIYQLYGDRDSAFLEAALDAYNEALAIFRSIGSYLGEANVLVSIGQLLLAESHLRDIQNANKLFENALAIYEKIGDRYSRARTLYSLGLLYRRQGDLERAVQTLKQSQNAFVAIGLAEHPAGKTIEITLADVTNELAKHYIEQGRWYDALHLFEESLAIYRQSDDLDGRADTIYQIARTHHLIGNLDKARTHYRDALRLYEHTQNQSGVAACKTGLGRLMIQMGFLDDAIRELESAKQIYQQLDTEPRIAEIEQVLQIANHVKEKQRI